MGDRRIPLIVSAAVLCGVLLGAHGAALAAGANMKDADGQDVGSVSLVQTPHGALVHARLRNMPPGTHAFHIHSVGKCEPPFKSAGGHFNPTNRKHGLANPSGMHEGDMPNIHIPASGALEIEVLAGGVNLASTSKIAIFDQDGSAIVIHAGGDDYRSDPAGDAGPRIACGVITE